MDEQSGFSITQHFDTDPEDGIARTKAEGEALIEANLDLAESLVQARMTTDSDSMLPDPRLLEAMFGPAPIYDDTKPPVPTHCRECGQVDGEERAHVADCPCYGCQSARRARVFVKALRTRGGTISFPKIEPLRTTP